MSNAFSGLEMLRIASLMEDEGMKFYMEGAKNTSGEVKNFLESAAEQEKAHKEVFVKMYNDLSAKKGNENDFEYVFDAEVTGYLKGLIENQVFDNKTSSSNEAFKDFKSAVQESLKNEERTVEIYTKMYSGITDPEAKRIMEKIIDEEKTHVEYFKSLLS